MKKTLPTLFGFSALIFATTGILLLGFFGDALRSLAIFHLITFIVLIVLFLVTGGLRNLSDNNVAEYDKKYRKESLLSIVYVLFVFGSVIMAGYVVQSNFNYSFDATQGNVNTLSSHTQKVISSLDKPVLIRVFSLGAEPPDGMRLLLDRYAKASSNIRWEALDPDKNRHLVETLGVQEKDTLYFSFLDKSDSDRGIMLARNVNEEGITNSLITLTRGRRTTVYVPQSHGEGGIYNEKEGGFSFLRESIEGEGYNVKKVDLVNKDSIPINDTLLLIIAPRKPLLSGELKKIRQYIENGGRVVLLLEAVFLQYVKDLLVDMGIEAGLNTIVDKEAFTFKDETMGVQPLVDTFTKHPSVKDFNKTIIMTTASSVTKDPMADNVSEIAFTSETSWAETNMEMLFSEDPQAQKGDDDIYGPVPIAAVLENETDNNFKQRISVIGDSDFVSNTNIRQLFNRDFFLNMLNWTAGENDVVKIRAGTIQRSQKMISPEAYKRIFIFAGVLLPEVLLILGIYTWVSRRYLK